MKHKLKLFRCIFAAFLCGVLLVGSCFAVSAAVTAESGGGTENLQTVYVAGCSDLYPVEYYDTETGCYKGLFPDILSRISKESGLNFAYLYAGEENRRAELAENKQVELVTALLLEDTGCAVTEKLSALTVTVDGKTQTYCIGFTEIASKELQQTVQNALLKITEAEKTGFLLSYATKNRALPQKTLLFYLVGAFLAALLLTLAAVFIIRFLKRKKAAELNRVDDLTGLGNAEDYRFCYEQMISEQAKSLYSVVYIAFQIEKCEMLWGREVCLEIQKNAAACLATVTANNEYAQRVENGVFTLLLQERSLEAAGQRVSEILNALNGKLKSLNADWESLFSGGICCLSEHLDFNAEMAAYYAKQAYLQASTKGKAVYLGSQKSLLQSKKNTVLRNRLNKALTKGEFKIYLQFVVNKNGEICGAEVLSRWQNPQFGLLHPGEYIELLRETGKIVRHDYNVFESVCSQLAKWNTPPYQHLLLSCNFTRVSLSNVEFCTELENIARKYEFDYRRLIIEITEDSLTENSATVTENLRRCRALGFKIAIDDMGSGFSSLADFYDNEIDVVKIEREFLTSCISSRRQIMLQDIINMVHHAGGKVVCEGVECAGQQKMLQALNCDMLQGFYFSPVLPLSECANFLKEYKPPTAL